jgi:hypothetical protein
VASSDISSSGRGEGDEAEAGFLNAVEDDLSRNDVEGFTERLQRMMYEFYGDE